MSIIYFSGIVQANDNSQWVEWIADAQVDYAYVDNLNLSAFKNDEEHDRRLSIQGTVGRFYQFTGNTRMNLAVNLTAEYYDSFNKLNNNQLSALFGFRHKFGLGYTIPYLQFDLSYTDSNFKENQWNNKLTKANLELGKHISDRLTVGTSLTVESMEGKPWEVVIPNVSTQVFDQNSWHASLFGDYLILQNWLLSFSYTKQKGDFHSACTPENVALALESAQIKAITFDQVFGGCIYKLKGKANIYNISLSYALTSHSSLNLSADFYHGQANTLKYESNRLFLSYNYMY